MISRLTTILLVASLLAAANLTVAQSVFGTPPSGAPVTGFAAPAPGSAGIITDLFIGRGVVGPYLLSWKGIDAGSETISRSGQRLARGIDYTLDPDKGILTFSQPLRAGQIARIDYGCSPGRSQPNGGVAAAPMQFKLFDAVGGGLSMNALFRPGGLGPADAKSTPASTAGPAGLMLLGLGGSARLTAQSELASKLFLDARGGSLDRRGAVQLSEKSKTNLGLFTAGYTRAGFGFKGAEETGLIAGKEILEAAGTLNPIHGIQAAATFKQTTDLPEKGQGATVTVLGQKLSGVLIPGTRILATRTETTTTPPDGKATGKIAERIQLDQAVTPTTSATALLERNITNSTDASTVAQTTGLSIRSQPDPRVSVSGGFQNRLLPSGAEDSTNLKVEATPTKQLRLAAAIGDRFTDKNSVRDRSANLEYMPSKLLTLSGLVQTRSDAGVEGLTRGFSALARPVSFLEFSGGVRLRESVKAGIPDPTVPDTYDVKLAVKVFSDALRLTGGYANNPEDDKGIITRTQNRSLGLQSKVGPLDLSGGYSQQSDYLTAKTLTTLDLRFGWRFASATQLITTYRQALTQDTSLLAADTYTISFSHKVGSLIDLALTGAVTTYEKDRVFQPLKDYKAEARLGLHF